MAKIQEKKKKKEKDGGAQEPRSGTVNTFNRVTTLNMILGFYFYS